MTAVRVELVPREFSSVVFGVMLATSVMSMAPDLASVSPEMAVTAIGTSTRRSWRRPAVTMITHASSLPAPGSYCAKAAGAKATRPSALVAARQEDKRAADGGSEEGRVGRGGVGTRG